MVVFVKLSVGNQNVFLQPQLLHHQQPLTHVIIYNAKMGASARLISMENHNALQ
ncbi:unnamed protein product [Meloidogyne enterolobii]|uniref:Uncharacterized protein n=1 Tax=Meloidogyne enterolobii TaxID=390850 RepID=A0ACB1ABR8_MELEN